MKCKNCGYLIEDTVNENLCPNCGQPLQDETSDSGDATESITNTVNESSETFDEDVFERNEEETELTSDEEETELTSDEDKKEPEENIFTSPEDNPESDLRHAQPNKKGGAIIAGFAAVVVVACVVIGIAVNSMNKKQSSEKENQNPFTTEEADASNDNTTQDANGAETTDSEEPLVPLDNVEISTLSDMSKYEAYIKTLGAYKEVEVSMEPEKVTDEAVEEYIKQSLLRTETTEEVKDRDTVQDEDIVNIDFVGYMDGEKFDGGSGTQDLKIGSGQFIEGFEEQLIGSKVGDTVNVEVSFPEEYPHKPEYAGKPAKFEVKINSISVSKVPELTDEWVKNNSEQKTVKEYKKEVRKQLEENAQAQVENTKTSRIMDTIYNNTVFDKLPEDEVNKVVEQYNNNFTQEASMYGMQLEDYISQAYGLSPEEYKKEIQRLAEYYVSCNTICFVIANRENLTLDEEAYKEKAKDLATEKGYDSLEALEAQVARTDIYNYLVMDRVDEFISKAAIETK